MLRERSYPRKIADLVSFLVPFLLIAGLALGGGGYDLFARHLAGIAAWILVGVLLAFRWPDPIRPGRSFALVGGLILGMALLSGASSLWSDSVPSSLVEFERAIGYLGIFTACYLSIRTPKQRQWFARGIAAGLASVIFLALGDRLLPGGDTTAGVGLYRLSYPLGYWNADGVMFAAGLIVFTWFAATARSVTWRAVSMGLAVLAATSLYLTYSRGGILVTTVALIVLLFATPIRLRVLSAFAVALAGATPILLISVNHFSAVVGEGSGDPGAGESAAVLLIMVGSVALACLAFEGLLRLAARRPDLTAPAVRVSRDRRTLAAIAGTGVATVLVLSLAFGNIVWEQFTDSDVPVPVDGKSRFTELSGSGRYEFNQVAVDTFADNPVLGSGAGTYAIEWNRRRDVPVVTRSAHSHYLESFAELGVAGGLLALALPISLLWLGGQALRRRARDDTPMVLAVTAGLFLSLFFDWFWELGATAALILTLAAWIAAGETVEGRGRRRTRLAPTGAGVRVGGLVAAWLSIAVLAVPALADHYNRAAADSVRAGNVEKAIDQARTASKLEPWSPTPHMQLGTIADSRGQFRLALAEFNRAIELDPKDWQTMVLRYSLNYRNGRLEAARRDFELMSKMNPVYFGQFTFDELQRVLS